MIHPHVRRSALAVALLAVLSVVTTTGANAAASALPAVAAPASALPAASAPSLASVARPAVSRVSGSDRYATSVAASRAAFATGTHPKVVYLISGTSPWHALSATPAAVRQGGGVLMTRPDGIPATVVTELKRLAPASIVVVGNTATLSDTVLSQARRYAREVRRVGGSNRYASANALVRGAFAPGSGGAAWLATGASWTDGVAAGAAAASQRAPLLTVDGGASTLSRATVTLIRDLRLTSITIVGPATSVSSGIRAQLTTLLGPGKVVRASGADRYAVSATVNRLAHPALTPGSAYVASGQGVVNALTGGFLAGRKKRPLLLSEPYCVPASVRPTLAGADVTKVVLMGGEGSIRALVGSLEACRSIESASSTWVLVNKRNRLAPKTYAPSGLVVPPVSYPNGQRLRKDAASATARMFTAARAEGAGRMSISSGYRSYSTQHSVYWRRVSTHGQAYADRWIARPGHSEHQTGLALDIAPVGTSSCRTHSCLGSTPQGAWVRKNAWRFGFVVRYESGATPVTGYNSEPWHVRFVGVPLSTAYHRGGWHTLEQFLAQPAAPRY